MTTTAQSIIFDAQTLLQDLAGVRWPASSFAGPWTKQGTAPVAVGPLSTWDGADIVPDDIRKIGSTYYVLYHTSGTLKVGIAKTTDFVTWTANTPAQLFRSTDEAMFHPEADKIIAVNGFLSDGGSGAVCAFQLVTDK